MFRGVIVGVVAVGLVCLLTTSMVAAAAPAPGKAPVASPPVAAPIPAGVPVVAPPVAAPIPAGAPVLPAGTPVLPAGSPPSAAAPAQTFTSLLQAASLAYTQPDKAKPNYHVMVESNGSATLVLCDEIVPTWKYADGSTVTLVHIYTQITPIYTQDNEPPAKFLRTALEENNANWFVLYTLDTNQKTGEWSMWLDSYFFVRGMSPDMMMDYFLILAGDAATGKDKLLPLMKKK
jgi:hypothetical protein